MEAWDRCGHMADHCCQEEESQDKAQGNRRSEAAACEEETRRETEGEDVVVALDDSRIDWMVDAYLELWGESKIQVEQHLWQL